MTLHPPTPEQLANLARPVDVADLLGVTRPRVANLARDHPTFPKPIHILRGERNTPLYWLPDIRTWEAGRDRRPAGGASLEEAVNYPALNGRGSSLTNH